MALITCYHVFISLAVRIYEGVGSLQLLLGCVITERF